MKCPKCESETTRVKDTRKFGEQTKRIRICKICACNFTTYEAIDKADVYRWKEKPL